MAEQWKWIRRYEGRYKISTDGRILSMATSKPKLVQPIAHQNGNLKINLRTRDGKTETLFVARLVADTFLGPFDKKFRVEHIDDDKNNNQLSNLRVREVKGG